MNFFRKGIEYHKLAQAFNGVYVMVNEYEVKLRKNYLDHSELEKELTFITFIARKEILDRLEEFNWDMMSPIYIPNISNGKITITFAYQQSVGRLLFFSDELGISNTIIDILDRGKTFYELEITIPENLRKKLY